MKQAAEAEKAAQAARAIKENNIVLGLADYGLEDTAEKVGGRTLLNDSEWQSTLLTKIGDPSARFTVSLDGMSGSSTYSKISSAAQRAAGGAGGPTDWEMSQLLQGGRLPDVTFVSGGSVVANPWAL